MSPLIVTVPDMHKIADFTISVKYHRPGNVVAYIPVEFEIFIDKENYKAVPVISSQNKLLTDLPNALVFGVEDDKICNFKAAEKEVVEDILSKLVEMNLTEKLQRRFAEQKA